MTTVSEQPAAAQREAAARAKLIASLREMADWLESNPAVPVDEYWSGHVGFNVPTIGEVGRVANLGKLERQQSRGDTATHYRALKRFGGLTFSVVAIIDDPAVKA
jgi:hypothetical protein